jgi:hypothetical protein
MKIGIKNHAVIVLIIFMMPVIGVIGVDDDKLAELLKQHKSHILELVKLREKAILDDEELRQLHEKILELHAQLAMKLERRPEIQVLNDKIIALEKEIESARIADEKKSIMKD